MQATAHPRIDCGKAPIRMSSATKPTNTFGFRFSYFWILLRYIYLFSESSVPTGGVVGRIQPFSLTSAAVPSQPIMCLINTPTPQFEEFIGSQIPDYAILPHTWVEEEVTFKDMRKGTFLHKKGYKKIDMTCQAAARDRIGYAWVDTCCIDKSSSAELTESIHAMNKWYQRAKICYVFPEDLPVEELTFNALKSCR